MRLLNYALAINEALHQMMESDKSVFIIGQGVKSPWYVGNSAKGLLERFGPDRVIDTPVSENAITGAAVGAAVVGMRPVVVHPRMDFMMYAMDPIINEAANWHYMSAGCYLGNHQQRRRAGGTALPGYSCDVCPCSGAEGRHALDGLRCKRPYDFRNQG
jgi:pyruvate/2-oxoglutarate/acetoin dehydrogenase E1 component